MPSKPGNARSDTTRSGTRSRSACSSAPRVSTRVQRTARPASSIASSSNSASSTLSSTSTMSMARLLRRRLVEDRPELPQRLDRGEELVGIHRLDHVGVDAQVPAAGQVALLAGGGQHDHGDAAQGFVLAHVLQHLQPVHARHLDVQQQHCRVALLAVGEAPAAQQVVHHFHAVLDVHDRVDQVGVAQRVQGHLGVGGAVFGQQDGADVAHCVGSDDGLSSDAGMVKWKVAPASGAASAPTWPPWRVTTRRTLARPMPVPWYSEALCMRWNTPNSLPAYCMSKPAPLSFTVKRWLPSSSRSWLTSMIAGLRVSVYLTALPSRLSQTW